jgi:signal transduction histidine kinase
VVNTVLEYSHIADGNGIFEKKGHAIRDIFNNAISDMKEIIKQKNLTVSNQIPKEIRIYIAEAHADTIAMNLISNAVKYTRNNDSIKIELTNRDNEVEICVSDTGIGMTPEECSRVFDEFYRADASRHDGESCGLGLAIVSKITSLYGAGITAYSEGVNKGSRFCILFEKNIIKDS